MGSRKRSAAHTGAFAVTLLASIVVEGCAAGGDGFSRDLSDKAAAAVAAQLDSAGGGERTAEQIVSEDVFAVNVRPGTVPVVTSTVTPVAWSGSTVDTPGGARIVIRISTEVERADAVSIGGTSYSAGSDDGCYEILITSWTSDESTPRRTSCPDGPPPARPSTPYVPPALPLDEVIARIVGEAPNASTARQNLLMSVEEGVVVETLDYNGGIVAAIGVPSERECRLAVRDASGEVDVSGVGDPEWLRPGEVGCSTDLITNPPR